MLQLRHDRGIGFGSRLRHPARERLGQVIGLSREFGFSHHRLDRFPTTPNTAVEVAFVHLAAGITKMPKRACKAIFAV
jgi:hypothetical protein